MTKLSLFNKPSIRLAALAAGIALASVSTAATLTRDNGAPVGDNQNSLTAGAHGSVLLEDVQLIEKLQRFDRERIPERVVHARGTGAHGNFVASGDFSQYTTADLFSGAGTEVPVFVRFSTVVHSKGSPETLRDPRGFATKFYTQEGNWDLVGNNLPVFFIRDAIKFPDMVHSLKPSPVTNTQDPNRFFDFFSHVPEATHMLSQVYTDLGTPASYRKMDGFGVHAYKWVNDAGEVTYVRFQWKSKQGIESLDAKQVAEVQSKDFNHLTSDLYNSIRAGDHPQWDLYVKILKPSQLDDFEYDPLDSTKVWAGVDDVKVGTMTLNRVPNNFHQATEQSAFAPSHLVPGIEPSEDRLLQGRVFSYADTQFHRLGANKQQLPINRPLVAVNNYNQDGEGNQVNLRSGEVNYQPSRTTGAYAAKAAFKSSQADLVGKTQQRRIEKTLNFKQAGDFYRSLSRQQQKNLVSNLAGDLGKVENSEVKHIMLSHFYKADTSYGKALTKAVKGNLSEVKKRAAALQE